MTLTFQWISDLGWLAMIFVCYLLFMNHIWWLKSRQSLFSFITRYPGPNKTQQCSVHDKQIYWINITGSCCYTSLQRNFFGTPISQRLKKQDVELNELFFVPNSLFVTMYNRTQIQPYNSMYFCKIILNLKATGIKGTVHLYEEHSVGAFPK